MSVFGSRVSRLEGEAKHAVSSAGAPLRELEQLKQRIQQAVTGSSTAIQTLENKLIQYGLKHPLKAAGLALWFQGAKKRADKLKGDFEGLKSTTTPRGLSEAKALETKVKGMVTEAEKLYKELTTKMSSLK
jgi:hypothetical protein